MITDEEIAWTRDALAHLYSTAFLQRHARDVCLYGRFDCIDGTTLQQMLLQAVQRLQPPVTASAQSLAWRLFNILRLRYLEGLPQAQVADELYLSVRHLKREQQRAVEAVGEFLFGQAPSRPLSAANHPDAGTEHPGSKSKDERSPAGVLSPGLIISEAISKGHHLPEIVRLDELLRASLDVMDAAVQQKNLHVIVTLSEKPQKVRADAMIVRQLVIAAFGWMIQGITDRTLEVRVAGEGGKVVLRFEKPSIGNAAEAALSTVRQLAEAISAQASVSEMDLTGPRSILEIRFPAYESNCVLMIDDDPDMIRLAQRHLQRSNEFYVVGVTQPEEAVKQVVSLRPACILMDLMMPGQDGWELLRLFKTLPESASIPVVISSVLREDDLARVLGATDVLPRPFSASQLIAKLKAVVAATGSLPRSSV